MGGSQEQEMLQRRTLLVVLALNVLLFVGLGVGGLFADSSALLANALDNGSDAAVYLISFLAVGRAMIWKTGSVQPDLRISLRISKKRDGFACPHVPDRTVACQIQWRKPVFLHFFAFGKMKYQ